MSLNSTFQARNSSYEDLLSASDTDTSESASHAADLFSIAPEVLVNEENTRVQCDNYLRVYRCWSPKQCTWIPFDPSTMPPPKLQEKQDLRNYFHEEVRYARPGFNPAAWSPGVFGNMKDDEDIASWTPVVILTLWSDVLLSFLRLAFPSPCFNGTLI